ncbi:Nuclear pore complex protein Nup85 [Phytophthora ramorum]|uniref:Nuclear pore complex protein Nup85 n=1 Tax=Phytophthora ramorum TaxID=164328 RepID=UPI0030AEEC62|nr:Nuclear pore complex protein Nup85 [Phytophthora ramorum]
MASAPDAFEILRVTRHLPVVEKELVFGKRSTDAAAARSTAGAAWGKSARKWVAPSAASREFGDAMPRELRTLVAASFDIFARVQQQTHQLGAFGIARASREYREALKTCIFALEDRLEERKDTSAEEEEKFLDLLKVSLAIWHLCELLLLRGGVRGADRTLAYDLGMWLQEHYCSTLLENTEGDSVRLKKEQKPEQDPAFWSTIQSLVMAGSGVSAWTLLATHSSYKSLFSRDAASLTGASMKASFQAVQRLLLSMPGSTGSSHMNMEQDGPVEWKNWHDACQYLLNTDGYIKSNAGLTTLLEIMVAKEDVLKSHATTWYELMMARLFLDEPKTIAHRFEYLMANCFRAYNSDKTSMGNFDCIILAILEYDVQSALQDIIALGFSWMAAHLADLLQKNNVIIADELLPQAECTLRERFLLEYAMEIGASSGMWQFAVRYYEYCPKFGAIAIRSALEREPLPTDYKAERLLAYCHAVQFMVGHPEFARPQKLAWLVRYREFHLVLDDCESLQQQLRTGDFSDNRSERAGLETKLRFVSMEAAKRLDWLFSSAEAPKSLRSEVLKQAEHLLKESPTVFGSRHLYSLMAYLQQLDRSFDRQNFYASGSNKQLKERIESLISRNLAEAMLQEASACGTASTVSAPNSQANAALVSQQTYLIADASFTLMED